MLKVTFTPAEFEALARTDLSQTTCVVFDILRATSTMVTALANGAERIRPVATIQEALEQKAGHPEALLCGERLGRRITAEQTKGTDFDLGNSPREYTAEIVIGKSLITTTTNGTRALRACLGAQEVLVSSFLNLRATIDQLRNNHPKQLVLVCGGTHEEAAFEDALAAGAIADAVWDLFTEGTTEDSAQISRSLWQAHSDSLNDSIQRALNARRLLAVPELAADVDCCLQMNTIDQVVRLDPKGWVS